MQQVPDIPEYFDLQVNGYKGIDFSADNLTQERALFACRQLLKDGTTGFLPTMITSRPEVFKQNLGILARLIQTDPLGRHIPGIHVEGPFLSPFDGARGAHNRDWIRKPDRGFLDKLMDWSHGMIRMLTMAAELPGAPELCRHATDLGITVSLGHQMAGDDDLTRMADAGATVLTHLGNGIPSEIDRHHNPLWAALANDRLRATVIADGHHLPRAVLKVIIRVKGVARISLVSDASPVAGLPPGEYHTLGNRAILREDGRLYNPEIGYLVGSSSNIAQCSEYVRKEKLLDEKDLTQAVFNNPLELIGMAPEEFRKKMQSSANR